MQYVPGIATTHQTSHKSVSRRLAPRLPNPTAVARNAAKHSALLNGVPKQDERWKVSIEERQALEDRYAQLMASAKIEGIEGPEDAICLWERICEDEGISIGQEEGVVEESLRAKRERQRRLQALLPGFAVYLKGHASPRKWEADDLEELCSGLEVTDLTALIHFLHFGLGLSPTIVSEVAPTVCDNLEYDDGWPYLATLWPILREEAYQEILEHHVKQDMWTEIVVGMPASVSAKILYKHHFGEPDPKKHVLGTYEFVDRMKRVVRDLVDLPQYLRDDILKSILDGHFTDYHLSAYMAEATLPHEKLPACSYRAETTKEKREFNLEADHSWGGPAFKKQRRRKFSDDEDIIRSCSEEEEELRDIYHEPQYGEGLGSRRLRFGGDKGIKWDEDLLEKEIWSLIIHDVELSHYETMADYPDFCKELRHFRAGDRTSGHGSDVEPEALVEFFKQCPNLIYINLEGHWKADASVLKTIIRFCPEVEFIGISGSSSTKGKITDGDLDVLLRNKKHRYWWRQLHELELLDQPVGENRAIINKVVKARPWLAVNFGDTKQMADTGSSASRISGRLVREDYSDFSPRYGRAGSDDSFGWGESDPNLRGLSEDKRDYLRW